MREIASKNFCMLIPASTNILMRLWFCSQSNRKRENLSRSAYIHIQIWHETTPLVQRDMTSPWKNGFQERICDCVRKTATTSLILLSGNKMRTFGLTETSSTQCHLRNFSPAGTMEHAPWKGRGGGRGETWVPTSWSSTGLELQESRLVQASLFHLQNTLLFNSPALLILDGAWTLSLIWWYFVTF